MEQIVSHYFALGFKAIINKTNQMNQREKFINAIKDCSLTKIDTDQMEVYARMFTDDLALEVVNELYSLKSEFDALKIERDVLEYKLKQTASAKPPVIRDYKSPSIFELKTGQELCAYLSEADLQAFKTQLSKNVTGIGLDFIYEYRYPDVETMLKSSFSFSNTDEGFDFWNDMVKRYGNNV
jgi:hypothetical protein